MVSPKIRAAGGVLWRRGEQGVEILVVHRDRYDDWTLPKGKLDPGESWTDAAVREVEEETAIQPLMGPELASVHYLDARGRPKKVRYWAMTVEREGTFIPNDEISDRRWMALDAAAGLLSYERDIEVLRSFRAVMEDTTG